LINKYNINKETFYTFEEELILLLGFGLKQNIIENDDYINNVPKYDEIYNQFIINYIGVKY
jgi:hypothetical protein